ncbi:zinc finger BED domain-containing protein RICESLEEPER 2-like [Canna indica]|uniref:Zinc finger BED domain-containing protein RICESLEEPER 2-like n=1 Tax=Canna indica TaxID=4628 RepID=A0AAQ3QJ77_9LILI|nr:zinc finger BED domain-containing protein RICESLEEPER 2-like [Canna indica]
MGDTINNIENPNEQETPHVGIVGSNESLPTVQSVDKSSPNVQSVDDSDSSTKKKITSPMWAHFKREKIDGVWKAICIYCNKKLGGGGKSGTSNLHEHYKRCAKRSTQDLRQMVLTRNENTVEGKSKIQNYIFDQTVSRKELANMIIIHEYPLSIVDHNYFRRYSHSLQPSFNIPTRNTLRADIMKIYNEYKSKIIEALESNMGRVAITTDMWTSDHQMKGYMAVTTHYIDDEWRLQNRLIRFCYVPAPHTKEVITDVLMDCFLKWNIDRKLSTLTVDNCSVNDSVIQLLKDRISPTTMILEGEFFHMRCGAHILNLIVKDGLDIIGSAINNIRESVVYWTATPKRQERKLSQDVKTRWNSTYLMLVSALPYKDVFTRLKTREPKYKNLPSDYEWKMAKEVCDKLKIFHDVTELFSGREYSTANIYFPKVCEIKMALKEWINGDNQTFSLMATKMMDKFEKYWKVIHGVMGVAALLDPRYKMDLIEYYYGMLYGDESFFEVERVRNIARNLVDEYNARMTTENERPLRPSSQVVGSSSTSNVAKVFEEIEEDDSVGMNESYVMIALAKPKDMVEFQEKVMFHIEMKKLSEAKKADRQNTKDTSEDKKSKKPDKKYEDRDRHDQDNKKRARHTTEDCVVLGNQLEDLVYAERLD